MKYCPLCVVGVSSLIGLSAFALLGGAGAAVPATAVIATAAPANVADVYALDPVHSSVVFKVKHLNVTNFYGRFNKVTGSFNLNKENPTASVLSITIDADSIDTNNSDRNTHVKGPSFFSVKEFPTITFVGKEFKKTSDNAYEVKGDLTLRGKTKSITVSLEDTGRAAAPKQMGGGEIAGVATTFSINRADYDMGFMPEGLSNEVTLMVGLEGGKK